MLESLTQTNIGSLNLEEPKREIIPFDPSVEITTADWDWIEKDVKRFSQNPDLTQFLWLGSIMKDLNPKRANRLKEFNKVWGEKFDYYLFNGNGGYGATDSFQYTTGHIKMAYRDKLHQKFAANAVLQTVACAYVKEKGGVNKLLDYYRDRRALGLLRVAFPDDPTFIPEQNLVLELLERFNNFGSAGDYSAAVRLLLAMASYVRLLGPADYKMDFKNDVWTGMRENLDNYRGADTINFSETALSASILAATHIDISNGLKLTIPRQEIKPNFYLPTPALPEVRKF